MHRRLGIKWQFFKSRLLSGSVTSPLRLRILNSEMVGAYSSKQKTPFRGQGVNQQPRSGLNIYNPVQGAPPIHTLKKIAMHRRSGIKWRCKGYFGHESPKNENPQHRNVKKVLLCCPKCYRPFW